MYFQILFFSFIFFPLKQMIRGILRTIPCQTSEMEILAKIISRLHSLHIFAESMILDDWQDSDYACDDTVSITFCLLKMWLILIIFTIILKMSPWEYYYMIYFIILSCSASIKELIVSKFCVRNPSHLKLMTFFWDDIRGTSLLQQGLYPQKLDNR